MEKEAADIHYISEKLTSEGYKLTRQRYEIIKLLHENNVHMNADEIYEKVKHKKIGLTTVYRNLMLLEAVGVVKRMNAANISYYELQKIGETSIHVRCIKCNAILDIRKENLEENFDTLIKNIKEEFKILISSTSITLSGICEKCGGKVGLNKNIKSGL